MLVQLICERCEGKFEVSLDEFRALGINAVPKRCPTCLDRIQLRPDITEARQDLFTRLVQVHSLPGCWAQFQSGSKDVPVWRMTVKGSRFGLSWNGRIEMFATTPEPPAVGQTFAFHHMEVVKQVAKRRWEKATVQHGTVSGWRQIPLQEYVAGDDNCRLDSESRQYVRLDPAPPNAEAEGTLVWAQAYTKTTFKGYGRQFRARIEGSPLWKMEVSGGGRSGRFYTVACLAVVEPGNDIRVIHEEGGEETITCLPPIIE